MAAPACFVDTAEQAGECLSAHERTKAAWSVVRDAARGVLPALQTFHLSAPMRILSHLRTHEEDSPLQMICTCRQARTFDGTQAM